MNNIEGAKMEKRKKYPIHTFASEREIICDIISDRKYDVWSVWKQLIDKKRENYDLICMDAFEQGVLMSLISNRKGEIPEIWKQLINLMNKFREDAGTEIIDLGNNMIQLKDDEGIIITREKYEWEM